MPAPIGPTATRASEVIGRDLYNVAGEKIGKVDDILLDKTSGASVIAIVSLGGAVTTSDDSYQLPFSLFDYSSDIGGYVVALTKEQIVSGAVT